PSGSSEAQRITGTGERSYFVRLAEMFAGVADGLHVAHAEGIIHREIKPSNLLLDEDGLVKIVDFGLARLEQDGHSMTITGDLLGTPAYMSPEQAMAKRVLIDHRTDIYSLGATLYEVLTLSPPFSGKNLPEICSQIIAKDPPLPRRTNRRIPRDLETIVMKTLEKDRDKRYQSARAFARDLRTFADGGSIRARRIGVGGRTWRKVKRHKVRSSLAAALLLCAVAGIGLGIRAAREAARRTELEYAALCARAAGALAQRPSAGDEFVAPIGPGDSARELYARAIKLADDLPLAYFGRALAPGGTLKQRLDDLGAAHARGTPERVVHLARAVFLRRAKRMEEAAQEEGLAAEATGEGTATAYFEGVLRALGREWKRAEAKLTQAIDTSPPGSIIHYLSRWERAKVREKRGDLEAAVTDLVEARAAGDRGPHLRIRIASLWGRLERTDYAAALFAEALRAARAIGTEAAWDALCTACGDCKETAWLDQVSTEALAGHEDSAKLAGWRGCALHELKRYEEALQASERTLEIVPDNAAAHTNYGVALHSLRRHEEALKAFDRAIEFDPELARAHSNRGNALK
ncbi:MAG: serine/threonine-protein kinase, partial [Planctomycetota bacterium]|nr:serine/threonine-protein kinase [Planctomycetota bacterium]